MPSCERCWRDAHSDADTARRYGDLVAERDAAGRTCAPTEQAGGPDALQCSSCGYDTMHLYARVCMRCGFEVKGHHHA